MDVPHSLSSYRGYLFAAWNAASASGGIYHGQFNTVSREWAPIKPAAALLHAAGASGPSIASDATTLFAAWRQQQDQDRLCFSMMFSTGLGWTSPAEICAAASGSAPALAVMGRTLYAAWTARPEQIERAEQVRQGNSIPRTGFPLLYATAEIRPGVAVIGTAFHEPQAACRGALPIPGASSRQSPALAVSGDGSTLYAAWTDDSCESQIQYASHTESEGWSAATPLDAWSENSPSFASYNGEVWMMWRDARDRSLRLQKLRCLLAGASGIAILPQAAAGCSIPSITECCGKLYALWSGADEEEPLSLACFDGVEWSWLPSPPHYSTR